VTVTYDLDDGRIPTAQGGIMWIGYQPRSRLVWFELARDGILVAVAALAVLAALWWLRKRPAE
jgi:hypothetical protein